MSSAFYIKEENDFYVAARDGRDIFVRQAAPTNDNGKAVVLAHGITGRPDEYIHLMARDFFTSHGYDVYRMSFYDDADNARKLHTTTLPLQANDLNDVVEHVSDKNENVFVCGHSYGGATTLFANPKTKANAFWDSSFYVWRFWDEFPKDENTLENELIGQSWRISMLFSKEMMRHARAQSEETMKQLATAINSPSIVLTAEEYNLVESGKDLFTNLSCKKDYKEIKRANHQFTNGHTVQDLLKETHNWFERF